MPSVAQLCPSKSQTPSSSLGSVLNKTGNNTSPSIMFTPRLNQLAADPNKILLLMDTSEKRLKIILQLQKNQVGSFELKPALLRFSFTK
jgi:hypothetical protein